MLEIKQAFTYVYYLLGLLVSIEINGSINPQGKAQLEMILRILPWTKSNKLNKSFVLSIDDQKTALTACN